MSGAAEHRSRRRAGKALGGWGHGQTDRCTIAKRSSRSHHCPPTSLALLSPPARGGVLKVLTEVVP